MSAFRVEVRRVTYSFASAEIVAKSAAEAKKIAKRMSADGELDYHQGATSSPVVYGCREDWKDVEARSDKRLAKKLAEIEKKFAVK